MDYRVSNKHLSKYISNYNGNFLDKEDSSVALFLNLYNFYSYLKKYLNRSDLGKVRLLKEQLPSFFLNMESVYLNLQNFINKLLLLDVVDLYSVKKQFLDMKLFISSSSFTINNFFFNKDIVYVNKNVYFFNLDKILFVLSQFSQFMHKIVLVRGQILLMSFDFSDKKFVSSMAHSWGQNFLVGKWVNGLFTNWLYFYRKLWILENNISTKISSVDGKYLGLVGLRGLPDFIFIFNMGNGLSVSNLLKESFNFGIPVSGVLTGVDEYRYITYPLFGDVNNSTIRNFYRSILIKIFKLGLLKRISSINL